MRIELSVPFAEKDLAKKLGVRWDAEKKIWYITGDADLENFKKWVMKRPEFNIKADSFFIADTSGSCWKCSENTQFITVGVDPGFLSDVALNEEFENLEDDELEDHERYQIGRMTGWFLCDFRALLYYVRHLSECAQQQMQSISPHYRLGFSQTTKTSYWMNHCAYCGSKQGDFREYCEPDGLFRLECTPGHSHITKYKIDTPLIASCDGYTHNQKVENSW